MTYTMPSLAPYVVGGYANHASLYTVRARPGRSSLLSVLRSESCCVCVFDIQQKPPEKDVLLSKGHSEMMLSQELLLWRSSARPSRFHIHTCSSARSFTFEQSQLVIVTGAATSLIHQREGVSSISGQPIDYEKRKPYLHTG